MYIFLAISILSALLYLQLHRTPQLKRIKNKPPKKSYNTGLMFTAIFYYGTPIWLWLYGLKTTILLLATCIILPIITAAGLGAIFIEDRVTVAIIGLFLQIPTRAAAGTWLAHKHTHLLLNNK